MPASLLSLPPELRLIIYEFIFPHPADDLAAQLQHPKADTLLAQWKLAILLTCRLICKDCYFIAFRLNIFHSFGNEWNQDRRPYELYRYQEWREMQIANPDLFENVCYLNIKEDYLSDFLSETKRYYDAQRDVFLLPMVKEVVLRSIREDSVGKTEYLLAMIDEFPQLRRVVYVQDYRRCWPVGDWPNKMIPAMEGERMQFNSCLYEWTGEIEATPYEALTFPGHCERSREWDWSFHLEHARQIGRETGLGCLGVRWLTDYPLQHSRFNNRRYTDRTSHVHIYLGGGEGAQKLLWSEWVNDCGYMKSKKIETSCEHFRRMEKEYAEGIR